MAMSLTTATISPSPSSSPTASSSPPPTPNPTWRTGPTISPPSSDLPLSSPPPPSRPTTTPSAASSPPPPHPPSTAPSPSSDASTDLRQLLSTLDAIVADLRWLLFVYDATTRIILSLPPIATTDPILSWVWSYIATIHKPGPRLDSATAFTNLALLGDRNKKIILEEGDILPLLALLRDSCSVDMHIAAANALLNLSSNQENVGVDT